MPLVKLTIYPEPVEVPEDEIPALRSQGLIEDEAPELEPDPVKPAPDAGTAARPAAKEENK